MAPEPASLRGDDTHMRLLCSHGGRFQSCGPNGELRHVGGETRVLVVPRAVSFPDLAARLAEMAGAGGAVEVRAIRHRLADEGLEDVLVTVTCDQEVAHMRDEYDRLRATRPAARFRVFVTTTAAAAASSSAGAKGATAAGFPPFAPPPPMRRVHSEQAIAARSQHQHRPTTRRVHSAQDLAGGVYVQPSFHHHHRHQHCCCCSCQRRDRYTPAPPPGRPTYALPYMSKKVAAPPSVSAADAAGRRVTAVSTEAAAAREKATARESRRPWRTEDRSGSLSDACQN